MPKPLVATLVTITASGTRMECNGLSVIWLTTNSLRFISRTRFFFWGGVVNEINDRSSTKWNSKNLGAEVLLWMPQLSTGPATWWKSRRWGFSRWNVKSKGSSIDNINFIHCFFWLWCPKVFFDNIFWSFKGVLRGQSKAKDECASL